MLRSALLTLAVAVLSPLALADVEITSPAAGASLPAGPLKVSWKDSGDAPALSTLAAYTLNVMVGGNTGAATIATANGQLSGAGSVTVNIDASKAGPLTNGFYIQMISTATQGGQVFNYSPRFSLTGMTGVNPADAAAAVQQLGGSTKGPDTVNQVSNGQQAGGADGAAAAGGAAFTVPYGMQTGLTKYAPMQPVPPTKITKKNPTPLNPTSAYKVATTWMSKPTILTTLTASQTFSVSSMENTAAAQSNPTGDMAKYLNRWKD